VNLAPALRERARIVVLLVGKAMRAAVLPFAERLGVFSGLFLWMPLPKNGRGFRREHWIHRSGLLHPFVLRD
jgi:hypothetical protein